MKKGFTLIEILAVVLIMAILTAVALPQYRKSVERARVAEALQMLPAIYDARDRLVTERNFSWNGVGAVTGTPSWASKITFSKLDVAFKGKVQDSAGHKWETDNGVYNLFAGGKTVSAQLAKGTYSGTSLYYDGSTVSCCGNTNNACDTLNLPENMLCSSFVGDREIGGIGGEMVGGEIGGEKVGEIGGEKVGEIGGEIIGPIRGGSL